MEPSLISGALFVAGTAAYVGQGILAAIAEARSARKKFEFDAILFGVTVAPALAAAFVAGVMGSPGPTNWFEGLTVLLAGVGAAKTAAIGVRYTRA